MSTLRVAHHHVNTQQQEGTGGQRDDGGTESEEGDSGTESEEGDDDYDLPEEEQIFSDKDSFAERLNNTINDGVEDIKQGKAIVSGSGKRNNEETRQTNFADEDEYEGILAQCSSELVQSIFSYEKTEDRMRALNDILNQEIAKLSPKQQAAVKSQPTASHKFSMLREFAEANMQNKRVKKGEAVFDY